MSRQVGSAAGRVDRYNMQSGLHRGTYGRAVLSKEGRAAKTEQGEGEREHREVVQAVVWQNTVGN